jgi:ankyrin repeat protein
MVNLNVEEARMPMSKKLTDAEILELQVRYRHLINYEADDPNEFIDPLTYVDSNKDSFLHIAAQLGDLRSVDLLLRAGVDVNRIGDMGCTALHCAKTKEVADLLQAHGASIAIRNEFGKLPGES